MKSIKLFLKKGYIKSFIICFAIALLAFLPLIIKGHGFFVLTNDFNDQQIPFTIGLHNALQDGGFSGFSWDVDLGTSTLDAFSFYEMGSLFFWITMIFPANIFPYIVAWLFMLKFAFAGVIAYFYLRRFLNEDKWAILGSILYAFSGYSLANMLFYHFHDAIVFFPLMLIGLERFKEKKGYLFFIFSIALNCFINYFFFMGEVIFLIVYYLCRFAKKDIKFLLIDIVKCVGCGVLGVGMAAFMFLPSIIFAMGNPRTGQIGSYLEMLRLSLPEYLYIIKCLLLPAETMTSVSAIYSQNFSSHGMYLPLVGLVLVIAYMIKHRDWLFRIIIYCTVASFIPLLSDLFYMYSAAQMRWWYMFSLMIVLATVKELESPDSKNIKESTKIYIAAVIIFTIIINILNWLKFSDQDWINDFKRFYLLVIVAVIGALFTCIYTTKTAINFRLVLIYTSIVSLGLMLTTTYIYKTCDWMGYQSYKQRYDVALQLELPNNQYRLNDTMNLVSMTAHVAGFTNQTSTNTNSIFEFEDIFDYYHNVAGMPKNTIPGLAELLAGKYYISFEEVGGLVIDKYETDLGIVYLKEREACPIGFAIDSFITKEQLKSMDVNKRAIALLDSVVLEESDITEELEHDLVCKQADDIDFDKTISEYVLDHTKGAVVNFNKDGHGMTCVTDYNKNTYVYFSVPYDTGWSATVDNKKIDIINSGGMMLIKVPAGQHSVRFTYFTPGLKIGLFISAISWLIFIGLYIKGKCKNDVSK